MGARKRLAAEKRKEEKKQQYFAILRDCPTSPRKMRLVADLIRGMEVNRALDVLKFSSKEASRKVEKLLLSAIANWQAKNEGVRLEENTLYVSRIMVDSGRILKRLRPAPQGRAHRIKKRSNHVTIYVDKKNEDVIENLN
ncbi:MAG: 50S ribosomal protein L22 [Bacteroidota bacterium]